MQTRILAALLCGCALASAAVAETLVVNDQLQLRESQLDRPKRGLTMDYSGFSVFFERDRVVHSVVVGSSVTSTSVAGT